MRSGVYDDLWASFNSMSTDDAPLAGFTVLDLTRVLSGPYCTMLLADMGARVIKIEQPGRGDDTRAWGPPFVGGESAYFLSINRNKESLTLDLKQPAARAVLDALLDARRRRWSRTSGRGRWRGWASTTTRSRPTASAHRLLLDLGLRPDRARAAPSPATTR